MLINGQSGNGENNGEDHYVLPRHRMVEEIQEMERETRNYYIKPFSEKVLSVMRRVPRHLFVPPGEIISAYYNHPLPIGHKQTISQPYIVALMTNLLALDHKDKVLEVGTGSGYQAAILANLVEKVFSIEIVEPLAQRAAQLLSQLHYNNVEVKYGDGSDGWREHAPYDAIIVTAAAPQVPVALIKQLKANGRMVIPVNSRLGFQELILINKDQDGFTHQQKVEPVCFVPLTGNIQ